MTSSVLFALLLSAGPTPTPTPRGPLPPPKVRAFFEAAQRARLETRPRRPELAAPAPRAVGQPLVARVEAWIDGALRFSIPLGEPQRRLFTKRGVPVVERAEDIEGEAIFRGRLYRTLRAGPDLRDAAGEALVERLIGQDAKLVLGRDPNDAHLEILSLRAVR